MDSDSTEDYDYPKPRMRKGKIIPLGKHQCLACGRRVTDRRNLLRHLRTIHCIQPNVRKPQLKCSFDDECGYLSATSELLRDHLEKDHGFRVEKKVLNFDCRADFENWKQNEEENTNARYVAYTGSKFRGSRRVCYLKCHRSGVVRNEGKSVDRKRSKPVKGYTQCGATCPSSIRIVENDDGSIQVTYYPVHLGHNLDEESIAYMKLSSKEKEEIVGKLTQGEPISKIISEARQTKKSKLSKINFLQRRDIYNLKKNVVYLEKEPDQDGREIDAWVKALIKEDPPCNPIALYNPIDEAQDYLLILIHNIQRILLSISFDGSIIYVKTKKGKPNIDMNLVTVSVVCENGEGYPIAFCVSNKTEYITLHTFFQSISESFGIIRPQIFVSDNIPHYYLAWKNVMGECENKLICTFGIESCWEQKLKCPLRKGEAVKDQLKLLLEETDKDVFEKELQRVVNEWNEDDDLKSFSTFFHRNYEKKRFEWATCYRIHSTRKESINKYLEPINSILDAIYKESYDSVSNCLNLLMSFVRDVCLMKLLQWDEQAAQEKMTETTKCHIEGTRMTLVRSTSGSEWVVTEKNGLDYIVRRIQSDCDKKCGVFCELCRICTHNMSCSCYDFVTGFNLCRHIHGVVIHFLEEEEEKGKIQEKKKGIKKKKEVEEKEEWKMKGKIKKEKTEEEEKKEWKVEEEEKENTEEWKSEDEDWKMEEDQTPEDFVAIELKQSAIWKPDLDSVSEMEAPGGILSMAVCDHMLYTCSTDATIQSWDLKAMKNSGKISTCLFNPQKLFVDPVTKLLWAGDSQGNVAKFENGQEAGKFELVEEIWDLIITSNPNLVYTARDRDVVVSEIVTGSDRTRVMVKCTLQGRSPFCITGNNFCFLDREGRNINVHENDVDKKFPKVKEIVASDLIINAMAGSGGDTIYSGGYDSTVKKWDLKTGNCSGSVNLGCCINAIACRSPNEVYVARSDGFVTKVGA